MLYEGYNDLMGDPRPNLSVFRHESPVFQLTGYLPIFPIVFKEKAAAMLSGGDSGALYHGDKTAFRADLATRTTAEVLIAAAAVGESLERQLGRTVSPPDRVILDAPSGECKDPWQQYCRSILEAVEFALINNKQVLVVTQPYEVGQVRARHMEQQAEMAAMLDRRFRSELRLRYLNLGESVDLTNPELSFDRMHLTPSGNEIVAQRLIGPVLEMARRRSQS